MAGTHPAAVAAAMRRSCSGDLAAHSSKQSCALLQAVLLRDSAALLLAVHNAAHFRQLRCQRCCYHCCLPGASYLSKPRCTAAETSATPAAVLQRAAAVLMCPAPLKCLPRSCYPLKSLQMLLKAATEMLHGAGGYLAAATCDQAGRDGGNKGQCLWLLGV